MHDRKYFTKNYSQEELNITIDVCDNCHLTIHKYFSNKYLAYELNSIDKLLMNEKFLKYINWISTRPNKMPKTERMKSR